MYVLFITEAVVPCAGETVILERIGVVFCNAWNVFSQCSYVDGF